MILAHGNAHLERGFSINQECIVENQKEKSLIARRIICDAIDMMDCPLENFVIDKQLIKCARMSYNLYTEDLDKEKKQRDKEEDYKTNRKRMAAELKDLENKKQKMLDSAQKQAAKLDEEIYILKRR